MSSILEKLWDFYLSEHPTETNPEAIKAMDAILDAERALLDTLTEEQKTLFLSYSSAVSDFHTILETNAFCQGMRCGIQIMTEAGIGK
ncbi:MAG: hypothetical protein IKZ09_08370 [Clostridia bacterium]|nr:hypothetical protein [Clostridia bacterium]